MAEISRSILHWHGMVGHELTMSLSIAPLPDQGLLWPSLDHSRSKVPFSRSPAKCSGLFRTPLPLPPRVVVFGLVEIQNGTMIHGLAHQVGGVALSEQLNDSASLMARFSSNHHAPKSPMFVWCYAFVLSHAAFRAKPLSQAFVLLTCGACASFQT